MDPLPLTDDPMRHLVLSAVLITGLSACSNKNEPPAEVPQEIPDEMKWRQNLPQVRSVQLIKDGETVETIAALRGNHIDLRSGGGFEMGIEVAEDGSGRVRMPDGSVQPLKVEETEQGQVINGYLVQPPILPLKAWLMNWKYARPGKIPPGKPGAEVQDPANDPTVQQDAPVDAQQEAPAEQPAEAPDAAE